MKYFFVFLSCLTLCACVQDEVKQKNAKETDRVEQKGNANDIEIQGFWVNEYFYNTIKSKKSIRQAIEKRTDDFVLISEGNKIQFLNLYEGAGENVLVLNANNQGFICNPLTSENFDKVVFNDDKMQIRNQEYINLGTLPNALQTFVNATIIAGKYKNEEQEVIFNEDGTLSGLKPYVSYELNIEANDALVTDDLISLNDLEDNFEDFMYHFVSDTLLITNFHCKSYDDEMCLELEQGETVYKLIKYK